MSSGAPFLPIEIIADVLKRLPVKSLIRFQSVCNLWKDLIKSPSFIASHLEYSDRENPTLISMRKNSVSGTSILYFLDRDMQLRQVQNNPFIDSFEYTWIVGSYNGLVCVQTGQPGTLLSIYLWNPAIREVIEVPRTRPGMDLLYSCSLGFAFSPTVNDYRIVRPYVARGDLEYGFEAYSLTTNLWKNIGMGSLRGICPSFDCITFNESMFWLASQRGLASHGGDNTNVILSLYLAMDEFRLISPPPLSRNKVAKLTVYENRLAIFHYSSALNTGNTSIDLWVIEEGIDGSWSKILTCGPYPHFAVPLTIWRNQIICDVYADCSVEGNDEIEATGCFLFDPTSNVVKVLFSGRNGILHAFFRYVESLVHICNIHTAKY
ncbi:unnamed protein product [Cuscuta europaea]|uniref:F-box domain-containing protein n=1 Tax=Cuscuta europaea TaxID=41803 RepID=A0A9P1DZT0_CUSEU|nr:unnamed protein product [Cuscuta europaea]